MRYLVLSDIHANWEALQAVVDHAAGEYDRVLCCGDLVGYGADPNPVVDWVREHCHLVVRGNHDKACTGQEDLEWFNPVARMAALWTQNALSAENFAYSRALPQGPLAVDGFQLVHGAPFDEDEYVIGCGDACQCFEYLESNLAFFGHTHIQGGFIWRPNGIEPIGRSPARGERQQLEIEPGSAYMINPGSVGQPRDGDPRAAYLLYDGDKRTLSYRRTAYDVAAAQAKIRAAGLPAVLADRLTAGR